MRISERIFNAVWAENLPLRRARGDSKQALRYAIIRKPLVCWMAARGNLEVLSNSAELDEAEEARLMGLPALSWFQSQSYPTPEAIPAGFLF